MAVSFIGGGNRSTRRKSPTCRKSLTKFITQCGIECNSPGTGRYVLYSSRTTNRFSNSVLRGRESCSVKPNAVSLKTCHGRYHKLDMITNWTTRNLFRLPEMFEDNNGVTRSHNRKKDSKRKRTRGKIMIYKHNTENKRSGNTNPTKTQDELRCSW